MTYPAGSPLAGPTGVLAELNQAGFRQTSATPGPRSRPHLFWHDLGAAATGFDGDGQWAVSRIVFSVAGVLPDGRLAQHYARDRFQDAGFAVSRGPVLELRVSPGADDEPGVAANSPFALFDGIRMAA